MTRIFHTLLLAVFVAVITIASYAIGQQAYHWMPVQGTAEAKRVDDLFSFLVAVGAFIFLGLTGIIAYSILTCRAAKDDFTEGHPARSDAKVEILWTVAPTLLVIWIAAQSFSIYQQLDILGLSPVVMHHFPLEEAAFAAAAADNKPQVQNQPKSATEEIQVTAKQWAWIFRYPRGNVTSTELHLPVNQTVQLALRSEDVLHGFYVPEFRVKQDIIPNRTITFVFTPIQEGKYRLRDSQFSGTYFSLMDAPVYIESPEAYSQWLSQAAARPAQPTQNLAFTEYIQAQKTQKSNWATVAPAPPPVVNDAPHQD